MLRAGITAEATTVRAEFSGYGRICSDIYECSVDNCGCYNKDGCCNNAPCLITLGGNLCMCKTGFQDNGPCCLDNCLDSDTLCHPISTCEKRAVRLSDWEIKWRRWRCLGLHVRQFVLFTLLSMFILNVWVGQRSAFQFEEEMLTRKHYVPPV